MSHRVFAVERTNVYRCVRSRAGEAVLQVVGERPMPRYTRRCALMPTLYPADYAALPSDIAQEVLKKLTEAWDSFFDWAGATRPAS